MNLISAFFKLIRWPNLVFIVLTQVLFYYCVFLPLFERSNLHRLGWLIVASVLIAAAGYIINDYFDLNIDQINKPEKNLFAKVIHSRWAIVWHFVFSVLGNIVISLLTSWTVLILFFAFTSPRDAIMGNSGMTIKFFRISFLYAGFAFISSLIREAIK